ncbi:LapA family protein [Kovacikia minuta CCNUW1]|uniref:LapA family protein n=1 Tax=Kovacikia minuta TaxID=2931930 RepID=UPI001CCEF706|nr:LapA family protein [Kovacikia minuta]UBF27529.1 LapA family protein [Kovacikia minuta CCNUW1]
MKTLATFLTSLIVAGWIGAIAVLSVQNFTPITIKFLRFESFQIPIGLVLAFSVGLGVVGAAIVPSLLGFPGFTGNSDEDY